MTLNILRAVYRRIQSTRSCACFVESTSARWNLRNEFADKRLCIFNCKLVSITLKNLHQRLKRRGQVKKKRACKKRAFKVNLMRFVSLDRREFILECTKIQSLKMRLVILEKKIEKLGGTKGKGAWPKENVEKIKALYALKFTAKEQLRELKKDSQEKNLYNCNPYYVAKLLSIDVVMVYRIMRQFAFTGKISFNRDERTSLPATAQREQLAKTEQQTQRKVLQTAASSECSATKEQLPLVLRQGKSPLGETPKISKSPRKLKTVLDPEENIFDSLTNLCNPAFGKHRAKEHPFVKEFKELGLTVMGGRYSDSLVDIMKLADYYRVETGVDDDCPPASSKLKFQTKNIGRRINWSNSKPSFRSLEQKTSLTVQRILDSLSLYHREE